MIGREDVGGDHPHFASIFESELGFVLSTLRRLGIQPDDAADLAQEVFVTVHRLLDDYDPARPLRPWLFGIAYRIARRYRAKARHYREVAGDMPDMPDSAPLPDTSLERARTRELVREAIDRIEVSRRAVFLLCDLEGATAPEAAEALGLPLNTVYSRLRRGREDFAKAIHHLSGRDRSTS